MSEFDSCYHTACPKREGCTLWHNAQEGLEGARSFVSLVNPRLIERVGGYEHCPMYHEYKLRRFARGLIWRYNELTIGQHAEIHTAILDHFGKATTNRYRFGYEAISPECQQSIEDIFERLAPGHKPQYRSYEEHYIKPARVEGKAARKIQ